MIDWTKPVRTVSGYPIRVLCTDAVNNSGWVVVGLVRLEAIDVTRSWKLDGTSGTGTKEYHAIQAPTKYYAGLYRVESGIHIGPALENESDISTVGRYIKTITFEAP